MKLRIAGAGLLALALAAPDQGFAQGVGDPELLAKMHQFNEQLRTRGLNVAVEQIEFFTIGAGRPSNRIHQQSFRWVAGDPRRAADGKNISYSFERLWGSSTASGVSQAATEAAIDRALGTWAGEKCLKKVNLVKRDPAQFADITIFDAFFGFGGFGDPFAADIVNAGFFPRAYFDAVGGPGGGRGILAFSVSFIFTDGAGNPTDINGDNYLDTALNEVYYNDTFGDPSNDRVGNPWGVDVALPGIDIETVGLHENGHSLELGHFGPPPRAVMNPVYSGINQDPDSIDHAGMCAVWGSWPK